MTAKQTRAVILALTPAQAARLATYLDALGHPYPAIIRGILQGKTQAALALALGISQPAISQRLARLWSAIQEIEAGGINPAGR